MAYKEKTITAGKVREVTKYHTSKCKSAKRPPNKQDVQNTQKEQKELNDKKNKNKAYKKLYLLMNANFIADDLYLTLTYSKEPTPEEAKKILESFMDKLRRWYKKRGFTFKYIVVTEGKRIHHHMLINNVELSIKDIKKAWTAGFMKMQVFMGEPEDCERLANYFIKESANAFNAEDKVYGQHWSSSRNLIRPVPEIRIVHSNSWKEEPKPIEGYYISVIKRGYRQDYPYQFYRMIKIDGYEKRKKKKKTINLLN